MRKFVAIALMGLTLMGCAAKEAETTEQPVQSQGAVSQPVKETSIDDAPNVDPKDLMVKEAPKPAPVKPARENVQPARTQVHMVSMNMKSLKYHEPGCRYYGCNNCDEVSIADAQNSGGVPCKKCH